MLSCSLLEGTSYAHMPLSILPTYPGSPLSISGLPWPDPRFLSSPSGWVWAVPRPDSRLLVLEILPPCSAHTHLGS